MGKAASMVMRTVETALIAVSVIVLLGAGVIYARSARATDAEEPERFRKTAINRDSLEEHGYAWGPANATTTLVVFGDFQCPGCRAFANVIDSVVRLHPKTRVIERHWPLVSLHPFAFKAALAAECGRSMGAYVSVRKSLYERPALIDAEEWGLLARTAQIRDTGAYATCVRSERFRSDVERDAKFAEEHGFRGTPTVILNGQVFEVTPDLPELQQQLRGSNRPPP